MRNRSIHQWLLALLLMLLALATVSWGQSTSGSITGTVKDSAGAPIVEANVTIANAAISLSRQIKTNNTGVFTAPQLPPGTYTIKVEKSGFKKLEKTGVVLNATDLANAGDFTLEVGAVTDTVTTPERSPDSD